MERSLCMGTASGGPLRDKRSSPSGDGCYNECTLFMSGGTKRATSATTTFLRLQSSEGKFTTSREVEPVRRSLRRRQKSHVYGSGTFGAFW